MMGERFPCVSSLTGHALSLLSTKRNSWLSASDFSSQCSAALHELIAENRTAMNGTQPASSSLDHHQMFTEPHGRSWWTLDA
ncbi:hypothetical protein CsSME_00024267 [Camellia sinensis var. sinensis]